MSLRPTLPDARKGAVNQNRPLKVRQRSGTICFTGRVPRDAISRIESVVGVSAAHALKARDDDYDDDRTVLTARLI
jgi:hypothetical protein